MALYFDLPLYKATYTFLIKSFNITKEFNKEYKFTLGEKVKNETIELMLNVFRANSVTDKVPYIKKAREHIEVVRLLIRVAHDIRQINTPKFIDLNGLIESISSQLVGWQKNSVKTGNNSKLI